MIMLARTRLTLVALIGAAVLAVGAVAPAAAQDVDPDELGGRLVDEFVEILKRPDDAKRAGLTDFLAEEFQIVRSNGTRLDRAGYIENPSTVFEVELSDIEATLSDGVLVVSYVLAVDEIIDGVATRTTAPRLSVFHEGGDGAWRIAAHANFGALTQAPIEG